MTKKKKFLLGSLGLILALVLCDVWLYYFHVPKWEPAFISVSPDGRFTVSVYYNSGIFRDPWGNDGTVVLMENATDKVLQRAVAEYVDSVTPNVTWIPQTNRVSIISVGSWKLPPEEPAK